MTKDFWVDRAKKAEESRRNIRRGIGKIDERDNMTESYVIPLDNEYLLQDPPLDVNTSVPLLSEEQEWVRDHDCDSARLVIDTINVNEPWQRRDLVKWLRTLADTIEHADLKGPQFKTFRFVHFYRNLYKLWTTPV